MKLIYALVTILCFVPASDAITHTLELTEYSSTTLVATYDGDSLPVIAGVSDLWLVTLPPSVQDFGSIYWREPEFTGLSPSDPSLRYNLVTGNQHFPYFLPAGTLRIESDVPFNVHGEISSYSDVWNNDYRRTQVTVDTRDGGLVDIVFHDLSDISAVPDGGQSIILLALGSVCTFGIKFRARYCNATGTRHAGISNS